MTKLKDLSALDALVGVEEPKQDKNQKALMLKMDQVYRDTLKRTGTSENSISNSALKQMLEGIYWRFKPDWPGNDLDYGKVFSKTFAGPLSILRNSKTFIVAPGVGTAVSKPRKPRVKKQVGTAVSNDKDHLKWMAEKGLLGKPVESAVQSNIAEAQTMQDLYQKLEDINEDLSMEQEVLLQFAGGRPFSVSAPHAKITDDNFFKVFSRQGKDTLIPVAEINLLEDPIVEVLELSSGDYIVETKHGVVLTILHPVPAKSSPTKASVSGFTDDIMPNDIME